MTTNAQGYAINTYAYTLCHSADACLGHLAARGHRQFEVMMYPGHLWPADMDQAARRGFKTFLADNGLEIVTLNMPNVDINVAGAATEMRAYSLELLKGVVGLAGDLGVPGVVVGPGKANPLMPALERYGDERLGVVYDLANGAFIREDLGDGLRRVKDRLRLVHLSDTPLDVYRHAPVGQGIVAFADVVPVLEEIGYAGPPMLEIISDAPDDDLPASMTALDAMGWDRIARR